MITRIVNENGAKDWTKVAESLPGRIGKQCRERWHNHLDKGIIKKKWTLQDDLMIATLHQEYQGRWSYMSKKMEGRTDNQIKNRYNSNLKKRIDTREFKNLLEKFQ